MGYILPEECVTVNWGDNDQRGDYDQQKKFTSAGKISWFPTPYARVSDVIRRRNGTQLNICDLLTQSRF